MRPDKKKTRHHDSVKCEAKAKQKAAEKSKKDEKSQKQKKQQDERDESSKDDKIPENKVENIPGASSVSDKVFNEKDPKYAKRSVTSNWTKYEIPPDDENQDTATGPEFQFVMEKSAQASDHLMLNSEKEWQKEQEIMSNDNEHFALNLKNLETALDCIPIYEMLEVPKSEIDVSTKRTSFTVIVTIKLFMFVNQYIIFLGRNHSNNGFLCKTGSRNIPEKTSK